MHTFASLWKKTTLPLLVALGLVPQIAHAQGKVTFGGGASTDNGASASASTQTTAPATERTSAAASSDDSASAGDGDKAEGAENEWAERDRLVMEPNTLTGGTGLLRTQHAQSGAVGQFRLGFVTEWFSASFLCSDQFKCQNPRGGAPITSSTTSHVGATLSLGISMFKIGPGTVEGYASTSAYANSDDANRPSLLQVLGDSNLGLKYALPLGNVFHTGLFTELWLINGTGSVGLDGSGTSAKFGLPITVDLRGLDAHVPLRFSTNFIYSLDNSGDVLADTEAQRKQPVSRIERFGLNVNRVDHFDIRVGGEAFLLDERIRPFLEYGVLIPSNRQGYLCKPKNPSGDKCLANEQVAPSTLTLGSRFYPWKRGFSLLAAFDIGLSGTNNFIEEMSPNPPWTLFIGGGWAIDTQDRPPVVRTRQVQRFVEVTKAAPRGHIRGFVHEKDKQDAVNRAIVAVEGRPDMTALATGADGKFTLEVEPGTYKFDVTADGYKPGTCEATVLKAGESPKPAEGKADEKATTPAPASTSSSRDAIKDVEIDCALEALPRTGQVTGRVKNAETNAPIGNVTVKMVDAQRKESTAQADAQGTFKFDNVPPGGAELTVLSDAYLALVQPLDVKLRQDNGIDLMLHPKPKTANVELKAKEIIIKQQVQFALDSATILPESFGLLSEVADTMIRNPRVHRVEIQGHTDNSGTPDHNKQLSEQRAESVKAWLVSHGVASDRIVAKGYGQDRPLVPNVTAGNRARNRRVQFIILDQDGAGTDGAKGGKAPFKLPPGF